MACIMTHTEFKHTLSIETEARPDDPPPPDLSHLGGIMSYMTQEKDIQHNHVCCYTMINASTVPIVEILPLPLIQPKCPPGWSAEAWDKRTIQGTTKYHFYYSALKPEILVLKVADRRENGKWVYESVDPTLMEQEAQEAMAEITRGQVLEGIAEFEKEWVEDW